MINKYPLFLSTLLVASMATAELRPYVNADIGFADTDYDNGVYFDVGAGLQFNDNIEFEIAYNDYGDIGPFGVDIDSLSYGLNVGGKVSENTRLFAAIGAERLEADGTARLGWFEVDVDDSSTEAFYGVGAAFKQNDNFDIRTKLISHDSGDIITLSVGVALYF